MTEEKRVRTVVCRYSVQREKRLMRNPGDTVLKDLDSSGTEDCWSGHPPWQEYGKETMLKEYDPWI